MEGGVAFNALSRAPFPTRTRTHAAHTRHTQPHHTHTSQLFPYPLGGRDQAPGQ